MPRRSSSPPQLRAPVRAADLRHDAYAAAPPPVRRALRARVRAEVENRPGVYRMLGATGLVLYVGKSKRLRTRLLGYFGAARRNRRRDKQARIARHAHAIEWEYCHSEFAALLRELRLIKQHRPRFNTALNVDEAPRGWVALGGPGAPGLRVVLRTDDPDAEQLYGPFRRLSLVAEAVRALADATGVRDCTGLSAAALRYADDAPRLTRARTPTRSSTRSAPRTAARATLPVTDASHAAPPPSPSAAPSHAPRAPGCLRHELGTCLGPCIAAPTAADYAARVAVAREFLAGRTAQPIDTLRAAMLEASAAWHFERAASLKAKVDALAWLAERLSRFHAAADRLTFRYRSVGHDGTERIYLVRRGTVRAEAAAPTTPEDTAALDALARRVFDGPDPAGADIPTHDMDEFYLVASWFRRKPAERGRVEK